MDGSPDSDRPAPRAGLLLRGGRRGPKRLGLALLALVLLVAAPLAAGRALKRIASALHHASESPAQARERVLGAAYVRSIAEIRAAIPPGGAYALVEAADPAEGGALWVRYELAPRLALDLGRLTSLPLRERLERELPAAVEWAVISNGRYEAPTLLSRAALVAGADGPALPTDAR